MEATAIQAFVRFYTIKYAKVIFRLKVDFHRRADVVRRRQHFRAGRRRTAAESFNQLARFSNAAFEVAGQCFFQQFKRAEIRQTPQKHRRARQRATALQIDYASGFDAPPAD